MRATNRLQKVRKALRIQVDDSVVRLVVRSFAVGLHLLHDPDVLLGDPQHVG